jgi:hypothetical protein
LIEESEKCQIKVKEAAVTAVSLPWMKKSNVKLPAKVEKQLMKKERLMSLHQRKPAKRGVRAGKLLMNEGPLMSGLPRKPERQAVKVVKRSARIVSICRILAVEVGNPATVVADEIKRKNSIEK